MLSEPIAVNPARSFDPQRALQLAARTFEIEAQALHALAARQGEGFTRSVQAMLECRGRVVVMGMGKSGHVGRKIAATLASTGTPAFFVHPAEASHGDLGMVMAGDVVLAISNSGESDELAAILPAMRRLGVTLVAMTGKAESTLAQHADHRDLQRRRPGGLPAEPGAHRQHHRADGAGRRAGGGAARRARFPRGGLRALAPRRQPRPQAADARARPDALGRARCRASARAPASSRCCAR